MEPENTIQPLELQSLVISINVLLRKFPGITAREAADFVISLRRTAWLDHGPEFEAWCERLSKLSQTFEWNSLMDNIAVGIKQKIDMQEQPEFDLAEFNKNCKKP